MTPAGLPHSDIHGSRPACGSPWLFAACYVLPRLPAPRHPPCALTALDQSPLFQENSGPPQLSSPNLRSLIVMTARRQSLSFPHPFCQKALPHLANRAELTKIKDPPIIVNPKSGSRYRGSEVGFGRRDFSCFLVGIADEL